MRRKADGFLRQVAEAGPGAAVHGPARHVVATEFDATTVGPHEAHHHVEGGGLAGTVGSEQSYDLAAL
jgi:hypothetical protein